MSSMRASSLLSVSKGKREPGSPERISPRTIKRLAWIAAIGLALLATVLLSASNGSGGDSGSGNVEPLWTVSGLEAASQAQHGGGAAEDADDTLAAAQKRVDKAIGLPPPQYRSHSAGMSLSPGAAEAAAACTGEQCELVRRFVLAAEEVTSLSDSGGCAVQHCPDALGIGLRPLPYTAFAFGNRCEPLYTRGALELVRQLLDDGGGWRGLEWFTGSSTSWFLARVAHLVSVETAQEFADKARSVAQLQFEESWLDKGWELRVIPPQAPVVTFADTESGDVFGDYCALSFLPSDAQFDIISVQGFARMTCLARAVQLLRPQGGLLVLPQAQRPPYARAQDVVPAHWLRFRDVHDLGETIVWMSVNK